MNLLPVQAAWLWFSNATQEEFDDIHYDSWDSSSDYRLSDVFDGRLDRFVGI